MQVHAQAAGAHDPVIVDERGFRLVQEPPQPRDGLTHAEELDRRHLLQLVGDGLGEVLIPDHAGGEAVRVPSLAEEHVGLRVLAGPVAEPVAVLAVYEVVGGGIGVDLEGQPRRDLPVVLGRAEAPPQGNAEPLAVLGGAQEFRMRKPLALPRARSDMM